MQDPSDSQNQNGGQMNGEGTGEQLEASMEEVLAGQEGDDRQVYPPPLPRPYVAILWTHA